MIDTITNVPVSAELVDLCDTVYHLAAAVGVRLIVESPVRTIETNVRGTEVILSLAAKKQKRVLITSTSEVYGKRDVVPFREDDDLVLGPTTKGRWSYACSKAIDEFLAIAYWNEKRVPAVIVRLFNTVGARQTGRYGMVIPNFVQQALAGHDITVYGDGSQRRCFTHVSDAVGAIIKLAAHPEAPGQVFNVGSDQEISMLELAERIREGDELELADRVRALRGGVPGGLRGHDAARAGHLEGRPHHRLRADRRPRPDPRRRDRLRAVEGGGPRAGCRRRGGEEAGEVGPPP